MGARPNWLKQAEPASRQSRAETTFAFLFDGRDPLLRIALSGAATAVLKKLLRFVFQEVRLEDDAAHEGPYTPSTRDRAEGARRLILSTLLDRPGADAFRAMMSLVDEPAVRRWALRVHEMAREKAERDSELPRWTPAEAARFHRERVAPVKTGADLLRAVVSVLREIQLHLVNSDHSSKAVLQHARNEDEVQNWLAEQLRLRSRNRYSVYREARVAEENRPDLIVSSTSASCEIAVEVKHGNMGWSLRDFENALRTQLAGDYLRIAERRHGVLVITKHGERHWRDPKTRKMFGFGDLISRLKRTAEMIVENGSGSIEVQCMGIDASAEN